jgi:hypothetical protein
VEKPQGRRGDWKEERFVSHLLGGLQTIEEEEDFSDIEKREGTGDSKSQTPTERRGAIEKIKRTARDLCIAHKQGENWISISDC